MAIGERIHFFRLLRGMTQKYLGMALGFPEKSADVRLAQYETGSRTGLRRAVFAGRLWGWLMVPNPAAGAEQRCGFRAGVVLDRAGF